MQTMIETYVMSRPVVICFICSLLLFLKTTTIGFGRPLNAQHQQVRQIQKKMMEVRTGEVQANDLKEVVSKLTPDSVGKNKEKACHCIYLLHDVFVGKDKMLKKPKFELGKFMDLHDEGHSSRKATGVETGAKVE